MAYFLQQCFNGLQVSVFYALTAFAYVLVHAVTHRINLAYGAVVMACGHLMILLALGPLSWHIDNRALLLGLSATIALAAALAYGAFMGALLERVTRRASGMAVLVVSIGLAIALEEGSRLSAGFRELWIAPVGGEPVVLYAAPGFVLAVSQLQLAVMLTAAAVLGAGLAVLNRHPAGRLWRAVADDARMAGLLAVSVRKVVIVTSAVSCLIAGLAGVLSGLTYGTASFYNGLVLGLKVLYIVVLGGLAAPAGAIAAAGALGFVETLWSAYFPLAWRDAASFAGLTVFLAIYRAGLNDGK